LGNGICNTFVAIFAIARSTWMIAAMNCKNKLVCCATIVGLFDCSGYCSTVLTNGFIIILILSNVALLCCCEIDSSSTLILNKFFVDI
jgi:hypothetical protein